MALRMDPDGALSKRSPLPDPPQPHCCPHPYRPGKPQTQKGRTFKFPSCVIKRCKAEYIGTVHSALLELWQL